MTKDKALRDLAIGVSASILATAIWAGSCHLIGQNQTSTEQNSVADSTEYAANIDAIPARQNNPIPLSENALYTDSTWGGRILIQSYENVPNFEYAAIIPADQLGTQRRHTYLIPDRNDAEALLACILRAERNDRVHGNLTLTNGAGQDVQLTRWDSGHIDDVLQEMVAEDATVDHDSHGPRYRIAREGIDEVYERIGGRNGSGGYEAAVDRE